MSEFASDLKYVYPSKTITLLHSRTRVMPIYPQEMHDESKCTGGSARRDELIIVMKGLKKLDVNVVLGERVTEWPDEPERLNGKTKKIVTDKGSVFEADLVVSWCSPYTTLFHHTLLIPSGLSAFPEPAAIENEYLS
jgi:hypothetical protein